MLLVFHKERKSDRDLKNIYINNGLKLPKSDIQNKIMTTLNISLYRFKMNEPKTE